ncbi:hypothetical protein AgCh_000842 [Apium graveolens]
MDKGKEKKKRKVENNKEETEDEKMEKFFALIKSTRRIAGVDRWKDSQDQVTNNEEKSKPPPMVVAAAQRVGGERWTEFGFHVEFEKTGWVD